MQPDAVASNAATGQDLQDQNGAAVGEDDEDLLAEVEERARARQSGQPAVLSVAASPDG